MTISWGSGSLRAATRAISRGVSTLRHPVPLLSRLLAGPVRELVQQHKTWGKYYNSPSSNAQRRTFQDTNACDSRELAEFCRRASSTGQHSEKGAEV